MNVREALEKANKQLMAKIDDAMTKEVFEEVQDEEAATIYSEVYKVYTPRMYRRRGEYGGLGDPYNIEIRGGAAKGGVMVVVNMVKIYPSWWNLETVINSITMIFPAVGAIWSLVLLLQKPLST